MDWIFCNFNFSCSLIQNLINQVEVHKFSIFKSLLVVTRTFMHITKEGSSFAIYATSIFYGRKISSNIPSIYQDF